MIFTLATRPQEVYQAKEEWAASLADPDIAPLRCTLRRQMQGSRARPSRSAQRLDIRITVMWWTAPDYGDTPFNFPPKGYGDTPLNFPPKG
jgi:hypothetical protein